MIRLAFILVPSIVWGGLSALLDPILGLLVFGSLVYIGHHLTKPHPERGEGAP